MVLRNAFFCLPLRLGTILSLYFYTLYVLWKLFRLMNLSNRFKVSWVDLFDTRFGIDSIPFVFMTEISIWSATIVCISNQTSTIPILLLWATIATVLLQIILCVFTLIQHVFPFKSYESDVDYLSELFRHDRFQFIIISLCMIYAVMVFYSYIAELKTPPERGVLNIDYSCFRFGDRFGDRLDDHFNEHFDENLFLPSTSGCKTYITMPSSSSSEPSNSSPVTSTRFADVNVEEANINS